MPAISRTHPLPSAIGVNSAAVTRPLTLLSNSFLRTTLLPAILREDPRSLFHLSQANRQLLSASIDVCLTETSLQARQLLALDDAQRRKRYAAEAEEIRWTCQRVI